MHVQKQEADKSPPISFDELSGKLSIVVANLELFRAENLSLAARVDELERRCSGLE